MSSSSGQQQFRYTQTPSKVLHIRNLPWECTEEELIELCKPFGKIVNTKCNVGANRNQSFVEFNSGIMGSAQEVDLNQAISMISYYASSSEPAQVRGKTVYLQYSNRQEIVNNKSTGEVAGNVLLVTIEGVEAGDVSIDVIHLVHVNTEYISLSASAFGDIPCLFCSLTFCLFCCEILNLTVFSAFGFVHKIATFEKAAGFQALIQYTDAATASEARNSLDGRSIPKYLLPEHITSCHLRITFSAHTDLNIKFQSHRSRLLPGEPTAADGQVGGLENRGGRAVNQTDLLVSGEELAGELAAASDDADSAVGKDLVGGVPAADRQRSRFFPPAQRNSRESRRSLRQERRKKEEVAQGKLAGPSFADYTNPYLPVNPSAIDGTLQPTIGPDGKIKEHESNVLLASIENMQYAVTVDVLHTVFSAFGTVHKIAIFEKNGGTQALIQYPDMTTAAVAKEALEGHCIYDGGYCKLHLSYSRHTDLNVKCPQAYSDKSRDYTITDTGILTTQASSVPAAPSSWQTNPQVAGTFVSSAGMQASVPVSQPFVPPGAPYLTSSARPAASVSYLQASQQVAQYGMHPSPAGAAPNVGQPPRYF
ncbi:hypothetical protein ZIOFF_014047 [Zingiber officinale]|uniref:RRM domain-containing protein n=1 Tax=Zingiber officinale TaxID=94328 RepID=A0A8J5HGS1_ZINOF|nr:hypothetical protein ZIOFF_014047 [Zingiber officinale]